MGLEATILRRWNRRDVLAVLVVGVTVAFVTGTTVLVVAATTQTTDVAGEFDRVGDVAVVVLGWSAAATAGRRSPNPLRPIRSRAASPKGTSRH
ncbi:MAG: hypothetical protein ACOCSF_04320 [Halanaeroarchaeum sp.]